MDGGNSFQDILKNIEALCPLLVNAKPEKLQKVNKKGCNSLHAYAWSCFPHLFTKVFSGPAF